MRNRVRQQLLEVADAVLDGARQCVYLGEESRIRMAGEIAEALPLFGEPEVSAQAEAVAAALTRLADGSGSARELVARVVDLKAALQAVETTYTIVFLPYNASMWDSLHTIWRAADADPRCEAIVVPIPFAELTPEHTAKEWFVHTEHLPAEVPVVDYRTFDLAAIHPDVVYVHNPYDGYNRVTSVHPDFYSEALRPHCELLVYVPYWVSAAPMEPHFDEHASFEIFDKVIYQSEELAARAIGLWSSNKIVPLGSPKFDYALTTGGPLPADWAERMAGRTTLLQLTTVVALLRDGDETLRKLDDVLDAVERNEDIALWWRPHPLERATIDSMTPRLRAAYDALVARASSMPRVIVDTSMDLQRAIHWTHAYFGHWSSVVPLYAITGKPLLFQDAPVRTDVPCGEPRGDDWIPEDAEDPELVRYVRAEWFHPEGAFTYLRRKVGENDGRIPGQTAFFERMTANPDGAGPRIHDYVVDCLEA